MSDDEPSRDDIDRVSDALRASAPARAEPDWATLSADILAAVDGEARRQRRVRAWAIGGAVLAAAGVALLLVWPIAGGQRVVATAPAAADAAPVESVDDLVDEAAVAEELALPDDLGGITLDDELIDEAAAALDDALADDADARDDRLLPDGAWIDELSDDELERAAAFLDGEAG